AALPTDVSESKTILEQPIEVTICHTDTETYLVCENPTPWTISARVELQSATATSTQLAGSNEGELQPTRLAAGRSHWPVEAGPHGLQIWVFSSPQVRAGAVEVAPDNVASEYLQRKIETIEACTGNL